MPLTVLDHSTIYRNPEPNLVSEYVAFPAIHALPDDTLLCMCRHGTARESVDGVVKIHRSTDGGRNWAPAGALPEPASSHVGMRSPGGFGHAKDGDVVAWICLPNAEGRSQGFTSRSGDGGATWSPLASVDPSPFPGMAPGGNLVTLPDGTMVAASETSLPGDDPDRPDWSSLMTRSSDGGRSWEPVRSVHRCDHRHFFDLRITGRPDGSMVGAYWTQDLVANEGLNVHMTWSSDAGETWSEPRDAGFWGQVTDVCGLPDGRVAAATNHRRAPLGVRALISNTNGVTFHEEAHRELWGTDPPKVRSAPVLADQRDTVENALQAYHHFTFGTPTVTCLSDGTIVAAFYVTEQFVTYVRCCRMVVSS